MTQLLEVTLKNILIASLLACSFHAWAADSSPAPSSSKSLTEILQPARNAIKAGNYEKDYEKDYSVYSAENNGIL